MRFLFIVMWLVSTGCSQLSHTKPVGVCLYLMGATGKMCGAGAVVGDGGTIATADHIVSYIDSGRPFAVEVTADTRLGPVRLYIMDRKQIVRDDGSDAAIIKLRLAYRGYDMCDARIGEKVRIEAPRGHTLGEVVGLHGTLAYITAEAEKGDSGSPVLSVERDCVVGVVSQIIKNKKNKVRTTIVPSQRFINLIGGE